MGAKPGQVNFEEWMSDAKTVSLKGKSYGGNPNGDAKEGEKEMEWVLREDSAGRFVCVKVAVGEEGDVKGVTSGPVTQGLKA